MTKKRRGLAPPPQKQTMDERPPDAGKQNYIRGSFHVREKGEKVSGQDTRRRCVTDPHGRRPACFMPEAWDRPLSLFFRPRADLSKDRSGAAHAAPLRFGFRCCWSSRRARRPSSDDDGGDLSLVRLVHAAPFFAVKPLHHIPPTPCSSRWEMSSDFGTQIMGASLPAPFLKESR